MLINETVPWVEEPVWASSVFGQHLGVKVNVCILQSPLESVDQYLRKAKLKRMFSHLPVIP